MGRGRCTDTMPTPGSRGPARGALRVARRPRALLATAAVALLLAAAAVLLEACGAQPGEPPTRGPISVSADGHGDYPTLTEAVREAPAGATVVVHPGTYRLTGPLDVFRSLRIRGLSAASTIVVCDTRGRVIGFSGNGRLHLEDLTLRHANRGTQSNPADVILAKGGHLTMTRCRVEGATSGVGRFAGRGGAGVRLLGSARATLTDLAAEHNTLAAVVCEPHATARVTRPAFRRNGRNGVYPLPGRRGPTGTEELAAFLDPTMRSLMKGLHVPGAVVSVVKDGRVLLSRGYGYADVRRRRAVDPERTLFRVASLTKVFTAVAVLQLVEEGRIDLEGSVAATLPSLSLPATYPQPITISDLLTHTSGFDERVIGMAAQDRARAPSLLTYLRRAMPRRVAPPGALSSYSNYNFALAGAVVQTAAGMPYESYVRRHILAPLGMTRTTFYPDGAALADLAPGYRRRAGGVVTQPRDVAAAVPAAQLYSTGADMARFMLCQLQDGRLGEARILRAASVRRMLGPRFAAAPHLPASGYAYAQRQVANRLPYVQTGDWRGYTAMMILLPEDGLGLFVAANSGASQLREELLERFMYHYYADRETLSGAQPSAGLAGDLSGFTGAYRTLRMAHGTLDKWLAFRRQADLVVSEAPDGVLVIDGTRYAQIEPLVFREQYGESTVVFRRDADGSVRYLARGIATYQRLRWYETFVFQRRLVILFSFVLPAAFIAWLATPLLGRLRHSLPLLRRLGWRRPSGYVEPAAARLTRTAAGLVALLHIGFLAGAALLITTPRLRYGVEPGLLALLVAPLVSTALTACLPVFTGLAWRRRFWGLPGRVLYTLVTLIALLFVWFLTFWNLLGFRV